MLIVTCIPYFIGWIIAIFSTNIWSVCVSRLFVGSSHALLTTSIYAIEISNKEMRATFSFLEGVPRCLCSIIVYVLGIYFRWQQIAMAGIVIPCLALICLGLKFCPESPVFLVNQGKRSEALDVLKKLNNDEKSAKEGIIEGFFV